MVEGGGKNSNSESRNEDQMPEGRRGGQNEKPPAVSASVYPIGTPKARGHAARGGRTCQKRPRTGHRGRGLGLGRREGAARARPLGVRPGPAAGAGTPRRRFPPGAAESARGLGRGPPALPRPRPHRPGRAAASQPGRGASRTCPRPAAAPPERAPSPTWRPRRASRTSRRDPAALGSSGAGARRRPRSAGSSPGRRQRTCCAACHGRSGPRRSLSPTTTWRPRPPQEAGGRGGRRRAGQLTTRPPARCRAPTARPREPAVGPGAAPHIHSPGHRTPQAWPKGAAVPSGKPRSPGPGSPSRSCDDPPGSSSPRLASYPGEGWWKMPSPHHHLTPSSIFWV
nr:translation initiation factor IF-2-like [Equus asinus]